MAYHRRRKHHANPKRRRHHRRHAQYMVVGRRYAHNPRKRHYSHRRRHYGSNPTAAMTGTSLKGLMPTVLGVTTGVLSVDAIPLLISKFLPSITTGVMLYATQAGTIIGGGMLAKKIGGREAQVAFVAGGIGKVILNFIGSSILSMVASIGAPAAATTTATTTSGYGAINQRGMGALTQNAPLGSLGALASEDSIY